MMKSLKKFINDLLIKLKLKSGLGVFYINGPQTLPAPLSKKDEAQLLDKIVQGGRDGAGAADCTQFKARCLHSKKI